ncbi:MAG: hypothetical protein KJO35_00690 [Gammaproteobacteria bacterium]|nr:hypothetical protein [Gammaproteobacteria bacterium]
MLLHRRFAQIGARKDQLTHHETEIDALQDSLAWAEPGDLIILLSLAEQPAILGQLQKMAN